MKRTLSLYIAREILPAFAVGLLAFTLVFLTARIVRLIEFVVTRGVTFAWIGKLMMLMMPTFLELTLPMALLVGILLGLGRLARDHEVTALKASGISALQILVPVSTLALVISVLTLLITTWARPAALLGLKRELYDITQNHMRTALREKVFNGDLSNVLIYIDEVVPPGNILQRALIVDRRNPSRESVIFGKAAFFLTDEESQTINLKLFDGTIHERRKDRPGFQQTSFNVYDFRLGVEQALGSLPKRERTPKEMSLRRLLRAIEVKRAQGVHPTTELIELHQRLSFPIAPLVFGLLAVALVLVPQRSRTSRSWALTLCVFWLLFYYTLLSAGKALGEREIIPAALAAWLPNLAMGLVALYFFRKALHDSPFFRPTTFYHVISRRHRTISSTVRS